MKNKKTLLISLLFVSLLYSFAYVGEAYLTDIENVVYPETVIIGKSFEVKVVFDYVYPSSALYGDYVYLYYNVGTNPVVDFTQYFTVDISELEDIPTSRPDSVTFEIDSDAFACEINDTFAFRIRYTQGMYFEGSGNYYDMGTVASSNYYLELIENPNAVNLSIIYFIVPLLMLSLAIIAKQKQKEKLK